MNSAILMARHLQVPQVMLRLLVAMLALFTFSCSSQVAGGSSPSVDSGIGLDEDEGEEDDRPDPGDDPDEPDDPENPDEATISLSPSALSIQVGDQETVTATVQEASPSDVSWSSSSTSIATVDSNGRVRGVAPGTATIRARIGSVSEEISVSVQAMQACISGTGNNGDSCASVHQGQDIWRCTNSPSLGNKIVSQVCRDSGNGPKWVSFHVDPADCCACDGAFDGGCCSVNSGAPGCP